MGQDGTMGDVPEVSVVVPTYQRARSIARTVRSVLAQSMTQIEVLVIDDGGTDDTASVLREMDDPRIRYLRHETNRGANAARTTGVEAARGARIAFLDSDDVWHRDKLAKQRARMDEAGPGYGICYCWYSIDTGSTVTVPHREPQWEGTNVAELLVQNFIGSFSCVMMDREALLVVRPSPNMPASQDWELFVRMNRNIGICLVPEVLMTYSLDVTDENRISYQPQAVAAGALLMYELIHPRHTELDHAQQERSRRYFLEQFGNLGHLSGAMRVLRDVPPTDWTPRWSWYAARILARASKRRLRSLHR